MGTHREKYYLIRDDILPEAIIKTIEAKKLLESGDAVTVHEAVAKVGLSRSAYYKYKDGVFPFNAMMREVIITVSLQLEHKAGSLSKVLQFIATQGGNILTINQSIPLQGIANLVLSIDTSLLTSSVSDLVDELSNLDGVKKAMILGQG